MQLNIRNFIIICLAFLTTHQIDCDQSQTTLALCRTACRLLYGGDKNFFNTTDQLCYKAVSCNSTQVYKFYYEITNNTCIEIQSESTEEILETNNSLLETILNNTNLTLLEEVYLYDIICVNGTIVTSKETKINQCVCDDGYVDSNNYVCFIQNTQTAVYKCDVYNTSAKVNYSDAEYVASLAESLANNTDTSTFLGLKLVTIITIHYYERHIGLLQAFLQFLLFALLDVIFVVVDKSINYLGNFQKNYQIKKKKKRRRNIEILKLKILNYS